MLDLLLSVVVYTVAIGSLLILGLAGISVLFAQLLECLDKRRERKHAA